MSPNSSGTIEWSFVKFSQQMTKVITKMVGSDTIHDVARERPLVCHRKSKDRSVNQPARLLIAILSIRVIFAPMCCQ